jgi:integrase
VDRGIYLKPNGKYLATFRDPGGRQRWAEFATKKDARIWRARGLTDPRSIVSGKRRLADVWEALLELHGKKLRPATRANWEQQWRKHIEPRLGSWPVGKITIPVVKEFMAELETDGVGVPTRQKCRAILHRILEEAVENQEISSNPVAARGTRVKGNQPKKARILSPKEVEAVLAVASGVAGETAALAIETMFSLGLRIGEMAGLQVGDVDLRRREITVQRTVIDTGGHLLVQDATKTNRYRVLPVPAEMRIWDKLLAHIRSLGLIGKAPLFPASAGGYIRPNNWRRRVWEPVLRAAGIEDPPPPHSARRTTASLLSDIGVPQATVKAILGHATLRQTDGYIDVPRPQMEKGLSRLAELFPPQGNMTSQ